MERKTWATMGPAKKFAVDQVFDFLLKDCRARRKAAIMRAVAATRED